MKKPKPNKRVVPRAQSLRVIAKGIRKMGRESNNMTLRIFANNMAKVFDAEAVRLRTMP